MEIKEIAGYRYYHEYGNSAIIFVSGDNPIPPTCFNQLIVPEGGIGGMRIKRDSLEEGWYSKNKESVFSAWYFIKNKEDMTVGCYHCQVTLKYNEWQEILNDLNIKGKNPFLIPVGEQLELFNE